jgi:NodT family efflux transporter outer membrane factor (OMF) lipoprotein
MTRMRKTFILGLLALVASGCVVGPDFQSPAVPLAMSDRLGDADMHPATGPAWWSVFGSPDVDATIRLALAHNRDLAAAAARFDEAAARLGARRGEAGPQLDLTAGVGRQKYGAQFLGPQEVPAFHYYSIGATASLLLDAFGGERRAIERERARLEREGHERDAAYLVVTGNVMLQSIALAAARDQIALAEGLVAKDEQVVDLAQRAFTAGEGTRMDILLAQRQLALDRVLLPPLRQDAARAEHALAVLLGTTPDGWSPPALTLEQWQVPHVAAGVPSAWVRTRPDILAAEAELHAATAAVGAATADLYPQIRLSASWGLQSTSASDLFDDDQIVSSLIAGLVGPVFDGGSRRARRDAAEAALRATLAQYEQTVLLSFGQVADLLDAVEHDDALIQAQIEGGQASRANTELARRNHAAGNLGIVPVLMAERTGFLARMGYMQARAQRLAHVTQLLLALGGGFPAQEPVVAGGP